jgi:hypothetical protein
MRKMSSALMGKGAMAVVSLEIKTRQPLADGRKFDYVGATSSSTAPHTSPLTRRIG